MIEGHFKALGTGLLKFIKKDTVLSIAIFLALVSTLIIRPDAEDIVSDVDWRSLGILMSLMIAVAGLRRLGIFEKAATKLLTLVKDTRGLVLVLVMICFFISMVCTNDVALITFVPFAIYVLNRIGHRELLVKTIALQTVAANMGSMLTPVGNPQNLYLYGAYEFTIKQFLSTMLPYTIIALLAIVALILVMSNERLDMSFEVQSDDTKATNGKSHLSQTNPSIKTMIFIAIFVLSLLAVAKILPWYIVLCASLIITVVTDYRVVGDVDFALLGTFIFFFIFIGNLGSIPEISSWLFGAIKGHEIIIAALSSQILSNVPATLLLSGFTGNGTALLIGVNIGGLGTLIASMASLISFKFLSNKYSEYKGKYLLWFSLVNFALLAVLLGIASLEF